MRRSSYTRAGSSTGMTPLRVSNRDNVPPSTTGARRSSSTTRPSTGASGGPSMKRPRVQKPPPQSQAPRRSSIFGRVETGPLKDPRPLSDRNYRERSVRKIVEFLSSEGYPNKVTVRTLSMPNTKDVVNIFNFLFQHFDPDYKIKGKPEEDIPRMLSMLDYPFQLARKDLFTVAAQHSWPHVLGALLWLVEVILRMRNIDAVAVTFPQDDDINETEKEILSMHFNNAYQDYLSGTDDFTPHEQQLKEKLLERWQQGGNNEEKLKEKRRRLKEHLDEIRNDPDTLEARQDRVAMIQTDIESHTRYVQQMTSLYEQLLKELNALEQLKQSQTLEFEKLDKERERKQKIIDSLGISPSDVMRMNAQKQELAAQIRVIEEQNAQLNDQVCNAEIKLSRKREAGDGRCSEVNTLVRNHFSIEESQKLLLERGTNISQITACFEKISLEVGNRVRKAESDNGKLRYKLEMATEKEDGLQKDLLVKQSANKTQTDELDRFMKCEREEMEKMQAVLDDLQRQINVVMAATIDDDDGVIDKVKRECDSRLETAKRVTKEYAEFLHKAVATAADHKLKMKELFKKIEKLPNDPRLQPRERRDLRK